MAIGVLAYFSSRCPSPTRGLLTSSDEVLAVAQAAPGVGAHSQPFLAAGTFLTFPLSILVCEDTRHSCVTPDSSMYHQRYQAALTHQPTAT